MPKIHRLSLRSTRRALKLAAAAAAAAALQRSSTCTSNPTCTVHAQWKTIKGKKEDIQLNIRWLNNLDSLI